MLERRKFFRCELCGNITALIKAGGGELSCCGQPMKLLEPNFTEASTEKHIPVVTVEEGKAIVEVGSAPHPMTKEHYIEWIFLCSENKGQRIELKPGDEPKAVFYIGNEEITTVYAYCNLHGLWVAEAKENPDDMVCSPEFPDGCM